MMHLAQDDGYRVHVNPDGMGAVFLEGVRPVKDTLDIIMDGSSKKINAAARRRGLVLDNDRLYDPAVVQQQRHLNKLLTIARLERSFTGEEEW